MPQINYEDYESLTVAELKEMAESQGIEIPSDARKSDIIDALATAAKKEERKEDAEGKEGAEGKNVFNYNMSSTVAEVPLDSAEFHRLKLTS